MACETRIYQELVDQVIEKRRGVAKSIRSNRYNRPRRSSGAYRRRKRLLKTSILPRTHNRYAESSASSLRRNAVLSNGRRKTIHRKRLYMRKTKFLQTHNRAKYGWKKHLPQAKCSDNRDGAEWMLRAS